MKTKHLHWGLVIALSLLAVLNIYKSVRFYSHPDFPYDARNVYLAGNLWLDGQNPYDDALLKNAWQTEVETNYILTEKPPGFPDCGMIYPFVSIPILWPYYFLPWSSAKILIWALSLIFFILFAFFSYKNFKAWIPSFGLIFLILVAFKSSTIAIVLGQPALFSLAAIMASWYFYFKEKDKLSGLLLGFATLKITLCFPFVLFFLLRKKWKLILFSSIIPLLSLIIFYMFNGDFYLEPMLQNISVQMHINYAGNFINAVNTNLTEAGILLNYFVGVSYPFISTFNLVMLLLGCTTLSIFFLKKRLNDALFLNLIILWTLLFSYHLIYDCLLLVFMIPCLKKLDWKWLIFLSPLFLPVNGMFKNTDWIQFHLPIVLLILFLYLVYDHISTNRKISV